MTNPTNGEWPPQTQPQRRAFPSPQEGTAAAASSEQVEALRKLEKRQRTQLIGAIATVVALVGGLLITFGLTRPSSDPNPVAVLGEHESAVEAVAVSTGTEVFLEPVQSIGSDAFFVDTGALVDVEPVFIPVSASPDSGDKSDGETEAVSGSEPGLYGGTKDNARCNRQQLVEFLEANPDKGAAWATAQDIEPADIRLFVDTLTPVVLLHDTRVTNHGFVNGRANPIQSVLQAGTAVLVDEGGLPRARCACGNPLRKPIPQTTVRYAGEPWSTFSSGNVQVVSAGVPSEQLVLQDVEGGVPFARPTGSIGDQDFPAPAAAVAAIRAELVVHGLGDQNLAAPAGGRVILGTAARQSGSVDATSESGELISVDGFTPIDDLADDVLNELFVPGEVGTIREAATAGRTAPAPTTSSTRGLLGGQPTAVPGVQATPQAGATASPTAAPNQPPAATVAPATPVPATPVPPPAATAVPATPVPQPTATPIPIPTPTAAPTATPPPRTIVDLSRRGSVSANSTFPGFTASAAIDGDVSTSWFSTGPAAGPAVLTWSGPRTELTDVIFIGNASHSNPEFQFGFGFASSVVEVLDGGSVVYSSSGGGEGWNWAPNVVGDTVRLTFTGHQDPQCGGFGELTIKGVG